jgi:hypothetical protein
LETNLPNLNILPSTHEGPGKSTYMFSAERLPLSAPRQASVVRATWWGSGKQKAEDVQQKMYMLIYPDPTHDKLERFALGDFSLSLIIVAILAERIQMFNINRYT